MSLHHLQTPLKDPLTWIGPSNTVPCGPGFDCGPARKTGEVWASECYGVTLLHWGPKLAVVAATVQGAPAEGSVVGIEGFAWTVRWSAEEAARRDRQIASVAAARAPQAQQVAA